MKEKKTCNSILLFLILIIAFGSLSSQEHTIAREWNEEVLDAIRNDFARPTVHARNLFHTSVAMYDAWALFEEDHKTYFLGDTIFGFHFPFEGYPIPEDEDVKKAAQEEAMAYAVFRILRYRFASAPGAFEIYTNIESLMAEQGYDIQITSKDYVNDPRPSVLGNYIADIIIEYGQQDGANELRDYRNRRYVPVNEALLVNSVGNANMIAPNRWQPLAFDVFIDQSGNVQPGAAPAFLSPEWGDVVPFSLDTLRDSEVYIDRKNDKYRVYHDPGPPPYLSDEGNDEGSAFFKWNFAMVAVWQSMLDPDDGVMWDISPRGIGNKAQLPRESQEEIKAFYDYFDGGDKSPGREINPITGEPYQPNIVPRGDYTRVLAEFWADGPDSETPPGHWFSLLHTALDHPMFERRWQGQGPVLDDLEYDVKAFFTLGGTMHDAAIATWSVKGWYDYVRPVSAIRYMATKGQSTDPSLENYDPHGLPIIPGYIEVIEDNDPLADNENLIGKMKILTWLGPDFIEDPETDKAGVGWLRGDAWWPYQRPSFVSPPFAGYVSGHSTYSRAAAEILTLMTGDEYFPGGVGIFDAPQNEFLVFEEGPSVDIELQWATYRDASDQTSLSRIWGGIHPPIDDIPGRKIGLKVAASAWELANTYFADVSSSIPELPEATDAFICFPNPVGTSRFINIEPADDRFMNDREVRAVLIDLQGRLLRSEIIRPGITSLDVRDLDSGTYVLNVSNGKVQQSDKIILLPE